MSENGNIFKLAFFEIYKMMYNLYSYSTSQKSVLNFKDEYLDKYRFLMISSNVFKLSSLRPIKFNFYKKKLQTPNPV